MKVKLLQKCPSTNPIYNAADHRQARNAGEDYDVPQFIELPEGHIIDHPDAWKLCMVQPNNQPPLATPIDAPAKKRVAAGNKRFEARVVTMRQMFANVASTLKKDADGNLIPPNEQTDRFLETCEAYGIYTKKPAKKAPKK